MYSAVGEIRAMLLQFERSGLKDLFLRSGGWTVFMARPEGTANPLAAPADGQDAADAVPAWRRAAVTAPHLGLFEPGCVAGQDVPMGALIGVLDVLGRKTEVFSNAAGRVARVCVADGDLVEYGESLVELDLAA